MTAPANIKKADVSRVIAGVIDGGMSIGRVEYENGKLVILSEKLAPPVDANPWDEVLKP